MNRENSVSNNRLHGSYVQLSTFDDKEKAFVEPKPCLSPPDGSWPYWRCLCTKRDTVLVVSVLVIAAVVIITSLSLGLPKIEEKRALYNNPTFAASESPLLAFDRAVVVADAEPCAKIGKDVLLQGGSVVDSAIATLFCDGVVNPESMGLGGGFFMTIFIKSLNESVVIDAREIATSAATRDMFHGNSTLSLQGGLSVAVPGELRGYQLAHKTFGKLPWKSLIEPSIALCNEGFKVSKHLSDNLQLLQKRILDNPLMKEIFFNNKTNDLYKEGEWMKRPTLGKTLTDIANEGADALYTGSLQKAFLEDISNCGGIITSSDVSNYKALKKNSLRTRIGFMQPRVLHTVPLPGGGPILSFILNVLENYNMTSQDFENPESAGLMYHRIIEAFKFGFAERTKLGDDGFVDVSDVMSNLLSKDYSKTIWRKIDDSSTYPPSYYNPKAYGSANDHGTAQMAVLSPNGDAVSVTSTVNTYFGSMCVSPSTGIILNNAMDDFSSENITNNFDIPPFPNNFVEPGKRPLSSMSPTILTDEEGNVQMVAGAAGGTRIITAVAQGIIRAMWLTSDIKVATDAPRIHHQLFPDYVQYEKGFPQIYVDILRSYTHAAKLETIPSIFQGILRKERNLQTCVDHRKGGSADGY